MALTDQERNAIRRYAQALADEAPELSQAQRDRLAALLRKRSAARPTAA
ncbi:hypothetical protein [Streptomyces sp. B21-101]